MDIATTEAEEERTSFVLPSVGPDFVPKRVRDHQAQLESQYARQRPAGSDDGAHTE
jgi:hypothetical protein